VRGDVSPGSRFAGPQLVAFDRVGNLYTTDAELNRIQKFTPEGKLISFWGSQGGEPGGFGPPPFDSPASRAPVVLSRCAWTGKIGFGSAQPIAAFNSSRTRASTFDLWVAKGREPGRFRRPHGLALGSRGRVYVVDTMNNRIQKFAVD
jgi:DNA-binding beta-propeller fold protein YncE